MRVLIPVFLIVVQWAFAQSNQWVLVNENQAGFRHQSALVYLPDDDQFLFSMGSYTEFNADTGYMYSEMIFSDALGKWINHLPAPSLYGAWADSTGAVSAPAHPDAFGTPYFVFKQVGGYLRPNLAFTTGSYAYNQYAYNSIDKKVYYYMYNMTFTYNTLTRAWDTLSPSVHPAAGEGGTTALWWGALCHDPVNNEIVLFGGGNVDAENGRPGTWTLSPSTGEWTRLSLAVQPLPRALSPMVYDPNTQSIVLFGGDHLDVAFADTWVYQCASRTWVKKNPPVSPSPRFGHAMVYLPKAGKVTLVGGSDYPQHTTYASPQYKQREPFEIWIYDVTADQWDLVKAIQGPDLIPELTSGGRYPMVAAADTSDRLLALGNETGGDWRYGTSTLNTYALAIDASQRDATGKQTLGVAPGTIGTRTGPYDPAWYDQDVSAPDTAATEAFLQNLPLDTWTKLTPPKNPSNRFTMIDRVWGTTIWDPLNDVFLVWAGGHSSHCGTDVARYTPKDNRWHTDQYGDWIIEGTYSNSHYPSHFSFNNRPFMLGHTYDNLDFDVNLGKMVLVKTKYTYTYDTQKKDWDSLRIPNHPELGGRPGFASVTSTPYGAFCWSHPTGMSGHAGVFYFFLLNGQTQTWERLTVKGETPPEVQYDASGAVYDPKRDRMILHTSKTEAGQLWAYTFADSTLTKLNPTGTYGSNGYCRESVYLPAQDIVIIEGDTPRIYDCATNSWSLANFTKGAGVGDLSTVNSGYMYDPRRDLVWVWQNPDVYVLRVTGGTGQVETRSAGIASLSLVLPNPAHPGARIAILGGHKAKRLQLFNVKGEKLMDLNPRVLQKSVRLPENLCAGVYWLRLLGQKEVLYKKVVVLR